MKKNIVLYGLPALALLLIFYPLFTAEYAYLDEAHQLWHNTKGANYKIFQSCGRMFTGMFMERTFSHMPAIASITWIRTASVFGWLLAMWFFILVMQQWLRYISIDKRLVLLSGVYFACSISLAIYNGWAGSVIEALPAFFCGLLSGHLLYMQLKKQGSLMKALPIILLAVLVNITGLFWYQVGAGAFLIPFFLHFAANKKYEKPDKVLITGVVVYLFITAAYFFLFKLWLKAAGIDASNRTEVDFNILKKIGFFFSVPLSQTFSFNFLYNLRSIVSQLFPIAVLAAWVVNLFATNREVPVLNKLRYLLIIFCILMLMYAPVLAGNEYFSPYRTMISLNLAAFIMITDMILGWLKKEVHKKALVIAGMVIFFATGFYNFRFNFLQPVQYEYKLVRAYIEKQYTPEINKIYFIRPPENLFYTHFNIRTYRDEFGEPSTYKDWTPIPLVKQIIFEKTHSRKTAEETEVVQFADTAEFNSQVTTKDSHTMVVDVAAVFNNNK